MEFLEVLTEGLNRVLLVRGGGREVITIYSWKNSSHQHIPTPSLNHSTPNFSFTYPTPKHSLTTPKQYSRIPLAYLTPTLKWSHHRSTYYPLSLFNEPSERPLLLIFHCVLLLATACSWPARIFCCLWSDDLWFACQVQCHIWYEEKLLMSVHFCCIPDVFSNPYFSHPIRRC